VLENMAPADRIAVSVPELTKMHQLRRARPEPVGDEEGGGQRRRRHPEADDICCIVLAMVLALLVCSGLTSAKARVLMLVYLDRTAFMLSGATAARAQWRERRCSGSSCRATQ
jgi:hypothetical protein